MPYFLLIEDMTKLKTRQDICNVYFVLVIWREAAYKKDIKIRTTKIDATASF